MARKKKVVLKSLPQIYNEYVKGNFNPEEYNWFYEISAMGDYYSVIIQNKSTQKEMAFDGATSFKIIEDLSKAFKVKIEERK